MNSSLNRRKFLGLGVAGVASLGFPNLLIGKPKAKLGIALLGLGSYSRGQLAPALQLTKYCQLTGIITGSPEKIPIWQRRYNISDKNSYTYTSMHEIANNDAIDVIYIVTPTGTHKDFALKAAATGKHVWCEKPMAMSVSECEEMINTCKKYKVELTLGYRMQHEPNTQTVNSYAKSLPFGNMNEIEATAGYYGGGGSGWRFQKKMGGGALYDMGVYTVNGMRYATGLEPIEIVSAQQYTQRPDLFKEVDETTEYSILFPNGIQGYGKTSVGQNINHLRIDCDKGWYELSPMQSYSGVRGSRSDGELLNAYIANQQAKQMDDDAYAILNNEKLLIHPSQGLRDIKVLEAVMKSALTGESVQV